MPKKNQFIMPLEVHFSIAFLIRLVLVVFGYFQDAFFDVKFTDIDYQVFSDAAKFVSEGASPYKRHTYRYTPFLSFILLPNITVHATFGKILFCSLDIVTSILIYRIQKNLKFSSEMCKLSTFMWLYNPLSTVISARGNAESIMTFFIMLSIYFYQIDCLYLLGSVYGLAIHFKIYPCIYALSFYFALTMPNSYHGWFKLKTLLWPDKRKLIFVTFTLIGFAAPTAIALYFFKDEYVQEALIYHLIRKDIRHNFSPYFYILYLLESVDSKLSAVFSFTAFLFQAALVALVSWVFASPQMLPACLFIQTVIFVTFNKVCTSQYFLWYLCIFPLAYPLLNINSKTILKGFLIWLVGQALWLFPAYCLEFEGRNTFLFISAASLLFFSINVYLICIFIQCLSNSSRLFLMQRSKNK